jgi:hypothetical protein
MRAQSDQLSPARRCIFQEPSRQRRHVGREASTRRVVRTIDGSFIADFARSLAASDNREINAFLERLIRGGSIIAQNHCAQPASHRQTDADLRELAAGWSLGTKTSRTRRSWPRRVPRLPRIRRSRFSHRLIGFQRAPYASAPICSICSAVGNSSTTHRRTPHFRSPGLTKFRRRTPTITTAPYI